MEPDADCIVYPRPVRSPLPAAAPQAAPGAARASTAGSDDFSGLREYQRTDSPRHVAWKTYAHSAQLMVKQFAGDAAMELWLDWSRVPGDPELEARLSRLCGWVIAAERAGARFGLRLPGQEIAPGRGDAHRAACLVTLALYEAP